MSAIAAGAAMGAGGGLLGLASSALSHGYNKELQRNQFEFQRYMSNTAYQRSVRDLKKAGLNPLLALPGGASTPSGSGGGSTNADLAASAAAGMNALANWKLAKSQAQLNRAKAAREIYGTKNIDPEIAYKLMAEGSTAWEIRWDTGRRVERNRRRHEQFIAADDTAAKVPFTDVPSSAYNEYMRIKRGERFER